MADGDLKQQPVRQCMGLECPNEAGTLQCPTCLKLSLKDSFFCSQDCFKRSWVCSSDRELLLTELNLS